MKKNFSQSGFKYICNDCHKEYDEHEVTYLCPECSEENTIDKPAKGVLKVIYDFDKLKNNNINFNKLKETGYIDILPLKSLSSLPKLKVGKTPMYKIENIEGINLSFSLFLKDDSQNPTFSFKDRASALVSAYAKENGIDTIVAASTGNAGSSLAGICASQGQKAIIMVPKTAPLAKLTQIMMYGAEIIPVDGTYDQAFDLSVAATEEFGWYNRNTAYNPLTVEGKKIVSFEIFGDLNQQIPDKIFVSVGDGVIISGVYKGFADLLNLSIISKMPVIVAIQAEGSSNLVDNIGKDKFTISKSNTTADSISVDIPRNFFMAEKYILENNGEFTTVTDNEIINASTILSQNTGLFAEPAATAAFAGFLKYYENNLIDINSKNVVLLTGSGLKDLKSLANIVEMPEPVNPDIESLKEFRNNDYLNLI